MEDERLVVEVKGEIKRAIAGKAGRQGVSIRDLVEPVLEEAFKKEIKELK